MMNERITQALMKLFSLKASFFNAVDTGSLAIGINKTQERVMMICHHHPGAQMSFLSKEAGLERGSLTSVIDSLERAGMVERTRDGNDGRAVSVRLTPAGKRLALAIERLFRAHMDSTLDLLDEGERAEFERAILTIERLIPRLDIRGDNQ